MTRLGHVLRWALFVVVAFVLNFPILATALTSLKTTADINASPPVWLFGPPPEEWLTGVGIRCRTGWDVRGSLA